MKTTCSLVADVGGTHIRIACLAEAHAPLQGMRIYHCAEFGHLSQALDRYLQDQGMRTQTLRSIGLALPGAVHTDPIRLVNVPWVISRTQLQSQFGCPVHCINDFTAQTLAIPLLQDADLRWLRRPGGPVSGMTRAIIGPGTGLGVGALLPGGEILDSEAGHIGFAPTTAAQQQLLGKLLDWFPRVSLERLLSGPGLANIYRAQRALAGREARLEPEQITLQARNGDRDCLAAVEEFNQIFASSCGDLALAFGAIGGVYLSGGILEKLGDLFDVEMFLAGFASKGRYTEYCSGIPVAQVIYPHPGLLGISYHMSSVYLR